VNILAAYAHYRWRAFRSQTAKPFNGLKDNDQWQAPKLADGVATVARRQQMRYDATSAGLVTG
jgi:hypothetical protein